MDHAAHGGPADWFGLVAALDPQTTLVGALFLTGVAGGLAHCAAMCGPFVLAQGAAALERIGVDDFGRWTRLKGAALVPYHLGRATTYAGLGALAGGLAGLGAAQPGIGWLPAVALGLAAVLFLMQGLGRLGAAGGGWSARLGEHLAGLARPLVERPSPARRYVLGLLLGFLPCGFLHGALAAAAGAGTAGGGAIAMAAFAAGTVPPLLLVGIGGAWFLRRRSPGTRRLGTAIFLANALLLAVLAWRAAPL
jgi:sulfite exporter TauE/SafE